MAAVGHRRADPAASSGGGRPCRGSPPEATNPTLTAAEALDVGLVTEAVADDNLADRAAELATMLTWPPARALSASKRLVWSGVGASVEQRLAEESRTVSELAGTADALEGLRAVVERRPARSDRR